MCKKFLCFMSIALILGMSASAMGAGTVWEGRIVDTDNDNEEDLNPSKLGETDLDSSDLEFPYEDSGLEDPQLIGLRFQVDVPAGSAILNAWVRFQVDELKEPENTLPVNVIIEGELSPDAPAFVPEDAGTFDISSRPITAAYAQWSVPTWEAVGDQGPAQTTVNIAPIIQEIIDQPGWASGNSLVLIISDDPDNPSEGMRAAEHAPGDDAALLHIEYGTPVTFEIGLVAESDDAEEDVGGSASFAIDLGSSDMEFIYDADTADPLDEQVVGLRFTGIGIPQGTTIVGASVRFMADDVDDAEHVGDAYVIIQGELSPNPVTFEDTPNNISARPTTAAQVSWGPAHWSEQGALYSTPDITSIIQEIVNQDDWASGNALALIFGQDPDNPSTGVLEAENFKSGSDENPTLLISAIIDIASKPSPADGAEAVLLGSTLSWAPIPAGATREVYFGTVSPPPLVGIQEGTSYYPGLIEAKTTYYWRVDEVEADGTTVHTGGIWSFTTGASNVPNDTVISAGNDDGEDHIAYGETADDGAESRGSSDLEMPWEGDTQASDYQVVGLRFAGMQIPKGAPISGAYVQFTADNENLDGGPVNLIISGLLLPDTDELGSGENFYDDRNPKTTAEVAWTDVPEWTSSQATDASRTPDISPIIQEIVNQDGWAPGNAIMLFIRDDETNPSADNRSALQTTAVLHVPVSMAAATQPGPANETEDLAIDNTVLSWWPGLGAVSHTVYLSTDAVIDDADLLGTVEGLDYALTDLTPGVTYFWRVDATDADLNVSQGNVWQFTMVPGEAAYGPSPANGGNWQIGTDTDLSWNSGVGAMIHHVYFSADKALVDARDPSVETQYWPVNTFAPGALTLGTTYYWAIDEFSGLATVAGPTWRFDVSGE